MSIRHFDGLSPEEIDALLAVRRRALAERAAQLYRETRSLRRAGEQLGVSYETVRTLLAELGVTPEGKPGPRGQSEP